jgi:hypothetical protein
MVFDLLVVIGEGDEVIHLEEEVVVCSTSASGNKTTANQFPGLHRGTPQPTRQKAFISWIWLIHPTDSPAAALVETLRSEFLAQVPGAYRGLDWEGLFWEKGGFSNFGSFHWSNEALPRLV